MGLGCGDLTDIRQGSCGRGELTWQYPQTHTGLEFLGVEVERTAVFSSSLASGAARTRPLRPSRQRPRTLYFGFWRGSKAFGALTLSLASLLAAPCVKVIV